MEVKDILIGSKIVQGIEISLQNSKLVMIVGKKGYLACGYFSIETAEKLKDSMAVITGVKTVEDMLAKKVVKASTGAKIMGVKDGMTGREAIEFLA